MEIIAIEVILMNNKNESPVLKLITNRLFVSLIVFAIGIILVSALWGSKTSKIAKENGETDTHLPVISKNEEKPEVKQNENDNDNGKEKTNQTEKSENEENKEVAVNFKIPLKGELLKPYSEEELLWDDTMQDWRTHCGIDILSSLGDEVDTSAAGIVSDVMYDEMYGTVVKIEHPNGVTTVYKNLEKSVVSKGDEVDDGQMIGTVGDKGAFEALEKPHLHFEVIVEDEYKDPLKFIPQE